MVLKWGLTYTKQWKMYFSNSNNITINIKQLFIANSYSLKITYLWTYYQPLLYAAYSHLPLDSSILLSSFSNFDITHALTIAACVGNLKFIVQCLETVMDRINLVNIIWYAAINARKNVVEYLLTLQILSIEQASDIVYSIANRYDLHTLCNNDNIYLDNLVKSLTETMKNKSDIIPTNFEISNLQQILYLIIHSSSNPVNIRLSNLYSFNTQEERQASINRLLNITQYLNKYVIKI